MNQTQKCPMCAEQIPLDAASCNYCGAKFEVTRSGYCQNCHKIREADIYNRCKVCSNLVVDARAESRLIKAVEADLTDNRVSHLPIKLTFSVLVIAVVGAAIWFVWNNAPSASKLVATSTPMPTRTSTPTSTSTATLIPTPTHTPTLHPTLIPTTDRRILNPDNQHLYLHVKYKKTWHEARDYCAALNGHLVTIQAPSENRFVYYLAVEGNSEIGTWLGGTDEEKEGTWVWVTGEPWNYRNWDGDQPDDWRGSHKYGGVMGADFLTFNPDKRLWADNDDGERYFVCEWEP